MRSFETKLKFAVLSSQQYVEDKEVPPTRTHGIYTSCLILIEGLNLFFISTYSFITITYVDNVSVKEFNFSKEPETIYKLPK